MPPSTSCNVALEQEKLMNLGCRAGCQGFCKAAAHCLCEEQDSLGIQYGPHRLHKAHKINAHTGRLD